MVLALRVGAHMTDNRNQGTEAAVAVGANERLTSNYWVLLTFLRLLHFSTACAMNCFLKVFEISGRTMQLDFPCVQVFFGLAARHASKKKGMQFFFLTKKSSHFSLSIILNQYSNSFFSRKKLRAWFGCACARL